MKNQTMKLEAINLFQILKSPRWMVMLFLLPILMMVHFAMAAEPAMPAAEKFDHAKIGFTLNGAHAAARCTACHINNVFKGTPRDCATCHATANHMGATAKNMGHVPTNVQCDVCHKTTLWLPAFFSHVGVVAGTCETCHNGTNAHDKSSISNHISTNLPCSECHKSTITFKGASSALPANHLPTSQPCSLCHAIGTGADSGVMNHLGITGNCISCHNGQTFAVGMKPVNKSNFVGHVVTSLDCSDCHKSTATFTGAIMTTLPAGHFATAQACTLCHAAGFGTASGVMNHFGITTGCSSCHTGQTFAVGVKPKSKPTNHIPTTAVTNGAACETCHVASQTSAGGFAGTAMNHAGITSNCASCHNNGMSFAGVTPKRKQDAAVTHVSTTLDCSSCHTSTITFVGAAGVLPAGHLVTTQACALCHAAGYGANSGVMNHLGISTGCASCHNNQTFAVGMKPKSKSTNHLPITSVPNGAVCETCHAISQTNAGGFTGASMNHTGVTTGCASCHGGTTFAGGTPLAKSIKHIPTTAMTNGSKCETCHAVNQTNVGGFVVGVVMKHTGITTNCGSCHNDGLSYSGAPKRKQDAATAHISTALDCSSCHTSTTTFTGASLTVLPAGHLVTTQPCALCHAAGYGSGSGVMSHVGIVSGCVNCHNGQTFAVGMKPMSKPTTHLPTTAVTNGTACETCHLASKTNASGFAGTAMNHTGIVNNCIACHNGQTFAVGVIPMRKQDAPTTHVTTTSDCSACHSSTTTFKGAAGGAMPANHIATAQPCSLCHAAGYSLTLTKMSHLGITTGCATCHNGQTFAGPQIPMVRSTKHIPYATMLLGGSGMQCEVCHKDTSSFQNNQTGKTLHNSSPGHGAGQCTGCHLSGTSYTGGMSRKSLTHDSPGHTDCSDSGCHMPLGPEGASWTRWK
jgi:Cytochrome c7 and related cytochrome c